MARVLRASALFAAAAAAALLAAAAPAHRDPCHTRHACPSDHHTYVWTDAQGRGWDCARPGADELDPTRDTTRLTVGGLPYLCRPTGVPKTPAGPQTAASGCHARGPLPDPACTPGAVFAAATAAQVCLPGYSSSVRRVSESLKRAVYAAYGILTHRAGAYEIDHLIPLELGGSNDFANLWPEPAGAADGYQSKDHIENRLHALVCGGRMALAAAQRLIAAGWRRGLSS